MVLSYLTPESFGMTQSYRTVDGHHMPHLKGAKSLVGTQAVSTFGNNKPEARLNLSLAVYELPMPYVMIQREWTVD